MFEIIDLWSLVHFVGFGLIFAWIAWFTKDISLKHTTISAFALGLIWEVVETRMEVRLGLEREIWLNRWLGDIFVDLIGALAGWLVVNLFVLKNKNAGD